MRLVRLFGNKYSYPFNTKYGEKRMTLKISNEATEPLEWNYKRGSYALSMGLACKVTSIEATGFELQVIDALFKNIPITKSQRVVTWSGEMAVFIVSNLLEMTARYLYQEKEDKFIIVKREAPNAKPKIIAECFDRDYAEAICHSLQAIENNRYND